MRFVDLTEFLSWIKYYIYLEKLYLTKMNMEQFKPTLIILLILNKNIDAEIDCVSHLSIQLYATVRKLSLFIPTVVSLHHGWSLEKKYIMLITIGYQISWEKVHTWTKEIHCYNILYHCLVWVQDVIAVPDVIAVLCDEVPRIFSRLLVWSSLSCFLNLVGFYLT